MTITSLVDDYCPKHGLRGEHGLSFLIRTVSAEVLFDAGQGTAFLANARTLGIDLSDLDAVVLSHGHYDHGGGLSSLEELKGRGMIPLYAGSGFADTRYSKADDRLNSIGLESPSIPIGSTQAIIVASPREIAAGLYILPKAERIDGSSASPRFRRLREGIEEVDEFDDELTLVVQEEEGIVVITGCAHRGIVNIAGAAMKAFPGKKLKALVGGFHLVDVSSEVLEKTVLDIRALRSGAVFCSHCTGLPGYAALSGALPGNVRWLSCGTQIDL
jgi:7,8-dihydropterin-6-yl-methyl-4-(beta-D-ribofuranosyl)aminobenzene 5'-phosphate synthase